MKLIIRFGQRIILTTGWERSVFKVLNAVFLFAGTAIVYPTFLACIAEDTNPQQRPKSLGVFRFWRDLGYVIGALLTGVFTDLFSIEFSIAFIGVLTILSSVIIIYRMCCKEQARRIFKNSKIFL